MRRLGDLIAAPEECDQRLQRPFLHDLDFVLGVDREIAHDDRGVLLCRAVPPTHTSPYVTIRHHTCTATSSMRRHDMIKLSGSYTSSLRPVARVA